MELTNATLYHFRDGRRVNKNWTVGNTFTVDSNYRNYICGDIKPIDANLSIVNKKIEYYSMVKNNESAFSIGEKMLELYRSENIPDNIGRIHCMYFCDAESLEYWNHRFPEYYELYEVVLNGEAFKACSLLFPFARTNCSYEEFLMLCEQYWNPDLSNELLKGYSEYLFQGKVFVKDKLDKETVRSRYKSV